MSILPTLGASPEASGTRFRVYAPDTSRVELLIESGDPPRSIPLTAAGEGVHECFVEGVAAGARYRYRLDDGPPFPDPISRYQPLGVHGPSEVIDPNAYVWGDAEWRGRPLHDMVLYELHVGTFTAEGTFAAAAGRLAYLRELGLNTIELMPLHDFPGERNWGYDCGALYAPAHAYGHPDDLRRLVDAAHALGLSMVLDVVYNHLGPDGAYAAAFDSALLNRDRRTPWGSSLNLDGPRSRPVREFLIQNALAWQREFHFDGFRLDAAHALHDHSEPHFLAELGDRLRAGASGRECVLITEDGRNLNHVLQTRAQGGQGLDGEWCFDIHHQFHRVLTDESHLYYLGFRNSARDLARAISNGWIYTGQHDPYDGAARGSDPAGIPLWRFVAYLQSHDEVGNRPLGDRLPVLAGLAGYRAALALLLAAPQTPMLFMGDEWAAATPFHFFTDHKPAIGAKVLSGRREFFSRWTGQDRVRHLERMPDPQLVTTFEECRLDWSELGREPHASALRYTRRLLALRLDEQALRPCDACDFEAFATGKRAVMLIRRAHGTRPIAVVAEFTGSTTVTVSHEHFGTGGPWETLFTSEDPGFAHDPIPPAIRGSASGLEIEFARPGAVILRGPLGG